MLHASDACSAVGATHYNTIVPVYNQSALSSQFSSPVPSTSAQWSNLYYSFTAPFNISDLYQTPVPKSIYTSQPWCASWAVEHGSLYGPRAEGLTAWDCPATRPYEPILVVDPAWYSRVDPAWASCHADMSGHYDPPIALTPAAIVATPTAPAPITAPSPAEASSTPTVAAATALSANIDTLLSSTQTVTRSPSEASVAGVSATISSAEPIDTSRSTAIRATPSIAAEPSSTANVQNLASAIAAAASSLGVVPATSTAVQTNNQADPDIADATSSADVQNLLSGIGLVATAASQSSADGGEPSVVAAPEVSAGSIVTPQSTDAAARQSAFGTASANDPQVSASPLVASGSSQVLSAGPISTLNGDPVSKGPGGAVVSSVQTVTPGLATTVHGVAFSVPTGGLVVFGGDQTLSVGQLTTLSGDVISVGSDGVAINFAQTVAQGKVTTIQETIFANPTIAPAVIGSDGQSLDDLDTSDAEDASSLIVTLAPDGDYVVQGHTLTPGIGSITIGSGTYQALPSGSGVLLAVGGATTTLLPDAALGAAHGPVVALASDGDYVVQGQTLAPGSVVMTIGSSTYRALPSGAGILLAADGATTTLVPAAVETIADFTAADGHTLAVALEAASRIAIVNNTLTLNMNGPGTVIGGESVRLDSGGLVVNGITETWSLSTSTPTSSITSASEPGSKSMNTAPSQSAANATPTSQISGASQIWTPFSIGALIAILALSTSIGALG